MLLQKGTELATRASVYLVDDQSIIRAALRSFLGARPDIEVIGDSGDPRAALEAGAEGYLSKDSDPSELALAILAVHRGDPYVSPRVAAGLVRGLRGVEGVRPARSRLAELTPREREVFQLLALGKSNKEVASALDISLGTAKKHRENLQRKLSCGSAAELARLAIREGLLDV